MIDERDSASVPSPAAEPRDGRAGASATLVFASALLAAALASGGTASLLLATAPAGTPAGTPAASTSVTTVAATSPPGPASVTTIDIGDAITAAAELADPSVVTIAAAGRGPVASAGGSGIVVSADGLILTTAVVAATDTTYAILLADQHETTARVVASDAARGLVVLRAEATGLTPARLATADSLTVGQRVVAVGSPLGEFTHTVTSGIVSSLGRSIDMRDPSTGARVALEGLIQTDAAINAGSSGGPLLDISGTVVAVIATSASDGEGIGFAIPIGAAADLVARAGS